MTDAPPQPPSSDESLAAIAENTHEINDHLHEIAETLARIADGFAAAPISSAQA